MKLNKIIKTILFSCYLVSFQVGVGFVTAGVDKEGAVEAKQSLLHSSKIVTANRSQGSVGAKVLVAGIGVGALVGLVPVLYFRHVLKDEVGKLQEDNEKLEKLLNDLIEKNNSPKTVRSSFDIEDLKKQLEELLGGEEGMFSLDKLGSLWKSFEGFGVDDFIKKGSDFMAGLADVAGGKDDSARGVD